MTLAAENRSIRKNIPVVILPRSGIKPRGKLDLSGNEKAGKDLENQGNVTPRSSDRSDCEKYTASQDKVHCR